MTRLQERYVARIMRAVDDQPNVLYEVSNESSVGPLPWQNHLVRFIRANEPAGQKHPVGITFEFPGGSNGELLSSAADWISPNGDVTNPAPATGRKVVLLDTDHLCGVCGDPRIRGRPSPAAHPMLMDPWDGRFVAAAKIRVNADDARWSVIRQRLGVTQGLSERLDLARLTPSPELASSGYCLCDARGGSEYVVYLPDGGQVTVDVSASRTRLRVDWIDPDSGRLSVGGEIAGGGRRRAGRSWQRRRRVAVACRSRALTRTEPRVSMRLSGRRFPADGWTVRSA